MAQFMRGIPGITVLVIIILCMLSAIFIVFSFLPALIPDIQVPAEFRPYIPYVIIAFIFVVFGAIYFIGIGNKNSGEA